MPALVSEKEPIKHFCTNIAREIQVAHRNYLNLLLLESFVCYAHFHRIYPDAGEGHGFVKVEAQ